MHHPSGDVRNRLLGDDSVSKYDILKYDSRVCGCNKLRD